MTAHKPHATMKDSGVAWLGEVPVHWDIKPIWTMFQAKKQTGFTNEQLLSVYRDYGVIPKDSRDDNKNRESEDLSPYQLVVEGDLVTNKMKTWQGSIAVSDIRGIVSPAYFVYAAKHGQNNRYIHYLLRSVPYIAGYQSISKGIRVGQWDLDADKFRLFPVLIPPLAEQNDIVRQLESETAHIDKLIARKTRFIKLLTEKRQALITHAVTKGLNPNAKMKDSGVEWLGQVPERWSVGPLCYLSSINTGATPSRDVADYWNGEIPWLKTAEVNWAPIREAVEFVTEKALAETAIRISPPGTMLMAMYGQGITRGRAALLEIEATYNQACAAITFGSRIVPQFAIYFFMAAYNYIRDFGNETSQMNLNAGLVSKFKMTIPPRGEQEEIVNYLNDVSGKYDALIAKTERSIKLLREHRTALITAAVTGKIDLRENA